MRKGAQFRPFATRGRLTIVAILVTFSLFSTLTVALSIWTTGRSKNRATVVEAAARQRTLAERYVNDVLLQQKGFVADPAVTGKVLTQSAQALLEGGTAPAVSGDDDETTLPKASGAVLRAQIVQEQRLVSDLTRTGRAVLAGRAANVSLTAHERVATTNPVERLRVLEALTSNVALNVARSIALADDRNISSLVTLQVALGLGGLLLSLLLAWALVRATRRQTAHFRSLVTSSSELVLVLSADGCRYASQSVVSMLGTVEGDLLGRALDRFVHEEDRARLQAAAEQGEPGRIVFRMRNAAGDWRHLDAHLTDLRDDRQIQGVVVNARDITERVRLESELTEQARRDTFAGQLVEALEMADDETDAYEVVERAMVEVEPAAPMELLLSDSSRAHLERAAASPTAGSSVMPGGGCPSPVSPSGAATRSCSRSSEALNACPKLRDRPGGLLLPSACPISFMGRALGVLHTTGPVGRAARSASRSRS